jgi:chemotaxis protein methyltransferase CheR
VTTALDKIADVILHESGVLMKPSQRNALRLAIARVAPGTDPITFLGRVSGPGGRELRTRLIEEVTVQETSFLRDHGQLASIDWSLLHEAAIASGSSAVRVWSAACATGEEVYSLALLACEAFGTDTPPVRILGTDISGAALERARRGSYGPRAARTLDAAKIDRYFEERVGGVVVREQLRRLARFERHNLIRDPVPPAGEAPFHLILCRNILIYFEPDTAESVVASLERALHRCGSLVLGAPDALCVSGVRTPPPARDRADAPVEPTARALRRPLGRAPTESAEERLARAVSAADSGRHDDAIRESSALLAQDPMNADAYFLRGLVQLEAGDAGAAVKSLRGALYVHPSFGAAAFKLGRAYEAVGDRNAARRAYEQALRTIEHGEDNHEPVIDQVDQEDIAAACEARILALR